MRQELSLILDLLDDQVVDRDGLPIGRVDDLDIDEHAEGAPQVTGLILGAAALGQRLGGTGGNLMRSAAERLRDRAHPPGAPVLDPALIIELRPLVRLRVSMDEIPAVAGLERWLSHHVVQRLPGSGHASK